MKRRSFLASLAGLPFAAKAIANPVKKRPPWLRKMGDDVPAVVPDNFYKGMMISRARTGECRLVKSSSGREFEVTEPWSTPIEEGELILFED